MSTGHDDDALSWGDDDPTLHAGAASSEPVRHDLPPGFTAVGRGSEPADDATPAPSTVAPAVDSHPADVEPPASDSNVALVAFGILGGVYLLYTIGWVIGGLRLQTYAAFLVSDSAFLPFFALAVLAPAIWFLATLWLTRGRAAWQRFAWLIAGALLLVPWPFIMIGAVGTT